MSDVNSEGSPYAYTPVAESGSAEAPTGVLNLAAFQHPGGRLTAARVAMGLYFIVLAAAIVSTTMQVSLLSELQGGTVVPPDYDARATANDTRQLVLLVVQGLVFTVTAIVSLMLLYRLRSNVDHLGAAGLSSSPGWSVGWFFVPVANLWKPMGATGETWRASADPENWKQESVPGVISLWWTVWVLSGVYQRVADSVVTANANPSHPDTLIAASWVEVSTLVFAGVCGILFLLVLNGLTVTQLETWRRLSGETPEETSEDDDWANSNFGGEF